MISQSAFAAGAGAVAVGAGVVAVGASVAAVGAGVVAGMDEQGVAAAEVAGTGIVVEDPAGAAEEPPTPADVAPAATGAGADVADPIAAESRQ
jgi:hypothetical protein